MTVGLTDSGVRAVLLDIEGTTTPVSFVHEVLFPFARRHLAPWLESAEPGTRRSIQDGLRREHVRDREAGDDVPAWSETSPVEAEASLRSYVTWLMDRDRKSPMLKRLQGLIWEEGYRSGELRGVVYADVPPALRRWRQAGIDVAIYSSGSELAQRRLFESVESGSLTALLSGFFDTAVGAKTAIDSYRRIATALARDPHEVLFVSDVTAELVAAREAGCQPVLIVRPGNAPQPGADAFRTVRSFDEIP